MSVYEELKTELRATLKEFTEDARCGRVNYEWVNYKTARLYISCDEEGVITIKGFAHTGKRIYGWATFEPMKGSFEPSWHPQHGYRQVRRDSGIAMRAVHELCWKYLMWAWHQNQYMKICSAFC